MGFPPQGAQPQAKKLSGTFLSETGDGKLTVDIGDGLESDGAADPSIILEVPLTLGDNDDVSLVYDSGLDAFVIRDEQAALDIIRAVVDGSQAVRLMGDLTVEGTTTEVDDILTTDVVVEDANGNDQFHADGDAATPNLDAHGNELRNVGLLGLNDDALLDFGLVAWVYDSGDARAELRSDDIDGAGTAGDVARVPDGSADLQVPNGEVSSEGLLTLREEDGTAAGPTGFGAWQQASADRPAWLTVEVVVETDGGAAGTVEVDVDESGGTAADYSFTATVPTALGAGATNTEVLNVYLPAGAQYQFRNASDPNNANAVNVNRVAIV